MECIACTACMDACDEVMTKVKKPVGLIRYMTQLGAPPEIRLSPRIFAYCAIVLASAACLAYFVWTHKALDIQILRGTGAPYIEAGPDRLLNQFFLEASNSGSTDIEIEVTVAAPEGAKLMNPQNHFTVRAGRTDRIGFFIDFQRGALLSSQPNAVIQVRPVRSIGAGVALGQSEAQGEAISKSVPLVGPMQARE